MYTGRKVILTKPAESDAKTLQKWYLDKDFRYWYDSYVSNSLDMIVDDIKNGRDITDPGAKNDNNTLGLKSALSFVFIGEGKLRRHIFMEGEYIDQWILGITKEEYEQLSFVPKWKARK